MTLRERVKKQFDVDDSYFSRYETDLHILVFPNLMNWMMKNYEWSENVIYFIGAKDTIWEGKLCIDVPFAAWDEKPKIVYST